MRRYCTFACLHIHALQTAPKWLTLKVWAISFPKQILDFHGLQTLTTHNSAALWSIIKFNTSFGSSDLSAGLSLCIGRYVNNWSSSFQGYHAHSKIAFLLHRLFLNFISSYTYFRKHTKVHWSKCNTVILHFFISFGNQCQLIWLVALHPPMVCSELWYSFQ